ncbi:MAG: hypothetical protein ACLP5H_08330 [Desulfomonilaceae bacterium]
MKEEDVNAIALIDRMYFGAPRPEHYREKLGSATKGAGINIFFGSRTADEHIASRPVRGKQDEIRRDRI